MGMLPSMRSTRKRALAEKDRIENAERRTVEAAKAETERETYAAEYFNNHPALEWVIERGKIRPTPHDHSPHHAYPPESYPHPD